MRHLVLKSAILNSADRIEGAQGANHTAWDFEGNDWTVSEANSLFTALDDQMGAGLLNARRAVEQIKPGEYGPGNVPKLGWDYGSIGYGQSVDYFIDGTLSAGDYVSITLTWDRIVETPNDNIWQVGDQFLGNEIANLDVWLIPQDTDDFGFIADASISDEGTIEHIWRQLTPGQGGNYKIKVLRDGSEIGSPPASVNYGLSWWIGSGPSSSPPGDYNRNGSVGPEDYDVWKSNFGTAFADADGNENGIVDAADYTIWRNNFTAGSGSLATVPEPTSGLLTVVGLICGLSGSRTVRRVNQETSTINRNCSGAILF